MAPDHVRIEVCWQLILLLIAIFAQDSTSYLQFLQPDGTPGWSADSPQCVGRLRNNGRSSRARAMANRSWCSSRSSWRLRWN